ncbi:hypothetical protein HanRHA438_Chr02g0048201 [Helianthus annuus]|nr:hypothetical protein HanRHA438_Chr02g0048201 [Helianthus annuus]
MLQIFLCLTYGMIIKSTLGENEYQVCCDITIQETRLVRNEYQVGCVMRNDARNRVTNRVQKHH